MGLCFLDDPIKMFTDPATYSEWVEKLSEKDRQIVKEFSQSKWLDVDPATEEIVVPESGDEPEKRYTSKGMNTEETKLFSFVFNAFVFMQVFNQINARKLEAEEWNVFSGMMANLPFLGIMVVTIVV